MATSYANAGGTGDRRATITVTATVVNNDSGAHNRLVDGVNTNVWWWNGFQNFRVVTFDFGSGASKVIDAFKWYQSNTVSQGTWQWYGSNDGSAYTALGASFNLGAAGDGVEIAQPSGNTTGYRYYRLTQLSGNTSDSPFVKEIEFKIDDAAFLSAVASQTLGTFTQTLTAQRELGATASQTINAFENTVRASLPNFIHGGAEKLPLGSMSAGGRVRRPR